MVATNVEGDAGLVLLPSLGAAWSNSGFVLDDSAALPKRFVTSKTLVPTTVRGLLALGDFDGDGYEDVAVNA
jgi:hypothetical protein